MDEYTGLLQLKLENRGRTVIKESYASGAFKISRPLEADGTGQALLYLMNPGGGYVDGDRYKALISMGQDSQLVLTTQSATKIYKTVGGFVHSLTEVSLEEGALLEVVPDPVIAYENAVYVQKTVLRLQPGAALVYLDAWTPGWSPSGELFTYKSIDSLTELYVGGELQMADRLRMTPSGSLAGLGEMEGYTHYGSLLVVHERGTGEETDELYAYLRGQFHSESVRFGITNLQTPGFVLRIMARSTEELQQAAGACHDYVRENWLNKPPLRIRKY